MFVTLAFGNIYRIYQHMKWTVHLAAGQEKFITTDCPVTWIFHDGSSGHASLSRRDIEVRFPLSNRAMLALTHDKAFMDKLEKSSERESQRILSRLPEVRLEQMSDVTVENVNRTNAYHATRWAFSVSEQSWVSAVMAQPSKRIRTWLKDLKVFVLAIRFIMITEDVNFRATETD